MSLTLRVKVGDEGTIKTIQFDPATIVFDTCREIREKIPDANNDGNPADFGLFLSDEDPKKGIWLESGRNLEYYLLRNGNLLEYKKKQRKLRVRMLDGAVKTMFVDDSHAVAQLMITICTRIGITNHDEYSLVRELNDEEKERTLTLKRDKSIAKDQKKLDEMKKKYHTDDEMDWLDHSKTLRQQGVNEGETLLLRRKYFFSDQNVDARDPVQLNLLYVQTRDAILKGAHPVSQDEAIHFSGIQCQIQFGDHVDSKHKPGFLDLKDFLPKEYVKGNKGVEKKIFIEHRKLGGLSEIDGKVKYTQVARSLKTYGITFFLVKEKMRGRNKLVPRLLGITKESVLRVDNKTKEIIKTYPLTTVRRWAASPNSFTLDFGDYAESYYSVQTTEGEQISQLIAGYIDIILKKKKAKDHLGIDGDEESAMYEDSVSPAKATIIQQQNSKVAHANTGSVALPAVLRAGDSGQAQFSTGSLQKAQYSHISLQAHSGHVSPSGQSAQMHATGQAQRALLGTIDDSLRAVGEAKGDLERKAEVPPLGEDPASRQWRENQKDMSKQKVGSQLSAMNAATAQVVTLTSGGPDDTDYTAVGSAVQTISSNIGEFSKDVKMLAALQEEDNDGDKLLDAARRLAGAFSDLLSAAQPDTQEQVELVMFPRQNLLTAASQIGEASQDIMRNVDDGTLIDRSYEDMLLALAKAVANATAALVLKAKGVAGTCEEQGDRDQVISAATQCALSTSQLVACTKVVAPTIHNPSCQEQLVEAAKHVAKSVDSVVNTAEDSSKDEKSLGDLNAAATAVTKALDDLLQHIKRGAHDGKEVDEVDTILTATDRLFSSMGDTPEMVKHARILAQATSQLVNALKSDAEGQADSEQQRKLLAAAKMLADATARMVEAAKGCASSPQDGGQQAALRQAAEEVRTATSTAASNALKKQIINKLELAARNAASAATQLINSSNNAGRYNTKETSQNQLMKQCKNVADEIIPKLVQGIKSTMNNPESPSSQLQLIKAAQDMLAPGGKLVTSAKASVPTVNDQASAMSLTNAAKNLSAALGELRTAADKAQEACGSLEIDGALDQLHALENELEAIKRAAVTGQLMPLPGESAEDAAGQLGTAAKTVGTNMAQLLTAAAQGNDNYTGIAARDTANALQNLMAAVRGVASTSDDPELQSRIIACTQDVLDKSANLIEEAKKAVNNPNNPDNQTRLAQVAKAVSHALNNCVNCLPGLREVESAIRNVQNMSQRLSANNYPTTERGFQEIQIELSKRAAEMNDAAAEVASASVSSPQRVAQASNRFSRTYEDFMDSGLQMAGVTRETETRTQIVTGMKSVTTMSSKLLISSKSLVADPNAPNIRNQLQQAARAVTESINHLITVCTVSAPGQKECDNALRQMQAMRPLLENPCEPINEACYFECLDGVINRSKALGEAMTGISNSSKQTQLDEFCDNVRHFADSVCGLTENTGQAAYLVGIADSASEPGRPGLVDQSLFARANQAIQMACESLTNPASSQQQVLSAATVVAKHTSTLCNTCRLASSKTSNPVAKRHFVQSAKDVANSTANLVRAIKALDSDFTDANRLKCSDAAKPLLQAVDELTTFASSPEFASVPAKISLQARQAQKPITSAGKDLIDGACNMIIAAKHLAVKPRDPPTYQQYSNHSHCVSDAIKKLVGSLRECAPGQKECERSVDKVNSCIRELDQASLAAVSQSLSPQSGNSLQGYQDQVINSARELLDMMEPLKHAAKGEAEKLGHLVKEIANYMEPMTKGTIGCASKTMNSKHQMAMLDQAKSVSESALQMLIAAKEGGGNPRSVHAHNTINEACDGTKEMLQELLSSLEDAVSAAGHLDTMIDSIAKSMNRAEEHVAVPSSASYVDYQTNMVRLAKDIARAAQDMVGKSGTSLQDLGGLANILARDYDQLSGQMRGAVATISNPEVGRVIRTSVQDLGSSCMDLVRDAGTLQAHPGDAFSRKDLVDHARKVNEKVAHVLAALQSGARGTQACINAASTVSGIIGDLDTTIMFATAGTLNAESEESFSDHRENILKTAKALVEDTKTLVAGAASNQEQLAQAAQGAVMTITRLADCVKHGASSLGSDQPEAQVLLINAVKDVAAALADLISATKNASGKSAQDPSMSTLKDSAKVMVTNVTSLLKTVKTVEDEAARGTRALESAIEAIGQEVKTYVSTDRVEKKYAPEILMRATRPITLATAKAVAAGNSCRQEDVIAAANMGRKAISDLLRASKGVSGSAESMDLRKKVLRSGQACSEYYKKLLEQVNMIIQRPTPEGKQMLAVLSKQVATTVTDIMHSAEAIKGSDWVDPEDPSVIAEKELLGAANSIEAAAKKLAQLQPRAQPKTADESLNFDEQILEAAKSIASATAALVKAASAAQRELVAQGRIGQHGAFSDDEDDQWSQGLISAARMVAVATHSLCEAANAMVQGQGSEEKLISAAKQVASSTAQLLVACQVKADRDSVAMQRLQFAGNAVKRATEALVRAAQQFRENGIDDRLTVNEKMVGGIAQIIQAQEAILIKERELETARRKLETIRKAKYKDRPNTSEDDDSGSAF